MPLNLIKRKIKTPAKDEAVINNVYTLLQPTQKEAKQGLMQQAGKRRQVSSLMAKTRRPSAAIKIKHYDDVIMSAIASQIASLTIVYSTVYPGADQSKHQSSASLAFVRGIRRGPVNSPHKWPVTRKMFPFDDVIMRKQWNKTRNVWISFSRIWTKQPRVG